MTEPTRLARWKLAVAALLLTGAFLPLACGGLVAVGILTIGVSLIFTGSSPGWSLRDPAVTHVPGVAEPTIDLGGAHGPIVDRLIFLGGELLSPVSVRGQATAVGGSTSLQLTLRLFRADEQNGLQGAGVTLSATTVTVGTTATAFNAVLAFTKTAATTSFPGDIAELTIDVPSGEVLLDTTATRVNAEIFLNRIVPLTLAQAGGVANGRAVLTESTPSVPSSVVVPAGTTRTALYTLSAAAQPTYQVNGSSTGQTTIPGAITYQYAGAPTFSLVATATATTSFTLSLAETDSGGAPKGPVLATAGPLTADTTSRRLAGSFSAAGASFDLSTSNTGTTQPAFLGLTIDNPGPGDLTLTFDPAGFNSSRIVLPGPSVHVTFPTPATIEVSQPDPAFR